MEILSKYISEEFIYSIGWTIFHSVWIGAVISLLLFIALSILNRSSAKLRYNVSLGALISMLVILAVVFTRTFETADKNTFSESSQNVCKTELIASPPPGLDDDNYISDAKNEISQTIINFLNSNYDIVTLFWLAGILLMTIRFTGGLVYSDRSQRRDNRESISRLAGLTNELKNKLGIQRRIEIVESLISKVPMTTGILKPVIFIPIGVLTGIPYNQVEAIIAHELAHIKRNDYLVNIFQSIIEIILFYHPAVWWISSMIRNEREMACDDIALELSDEKLTYIKALVSISELETDMVSTAVAFAGNKKNLLNRIKRITKMKHSKLNRTDKWTSALMSIIIIAGVLIISGFSTRAGVDYSEKPVLNISESINPVVDKRIQSNIIISQDTNKLSGKITRTIIDPADKKEKDATFTFTEGELSKLIVDGKAIPESDYHLYSELIEETREDMANAISDMEDAVVDIEEAIKEIEDIDYEEIEMEIQEALTEIEEIDMAGIEIEIASALEEIREIDMKEIEFEMQEAITEIKESLREIEEIDMKEVEFEMQKALEEIKKIDIEQIKLEMMESMEGVKDIDLDKIMREMEKSIEEIKESLKDIEIDQRKNFEDQKKNFEAQKKALEKQLIEIQERETKKEKEKFN